MSGGAYEYVYRYIDGIEIMNLTPKREIFQKLLKLVAEAMHDIEWVDSGDYGEGVENAAIDRVISFIKYPHDELRDVILKELKGIE